MSKKKIGYLSGLACILILCLMLFGGGEKQQLSGELLENGDFSLLDENGMPEGWCPNNLRIQYAQEEMKAT